MDASPTDLRNMAARHEELARKLREAADLLESLSSTASPPLHIERRSKQSQKERELIDYLRQNGPASAEQVAVNSSIKLSTVYALCHPKDGKPKLFALDKKTKKISLIEENIRQVESRPDL